MELSSPFSYPIKKDLLALLGIILYPRQARADNNNSYGNPGSIPYIRLPAALRRCNLALRLRRGVEFAEGR